MPSCASSPIPGSPTKTAPFDEAAYLQANPDVTAALARGEFTSGEDHFRHFGWREDRPLRLPPVESVAYLAAHPDVAAAVQSGEFRDAHHHFTQVGWRERAVLGCRSEPLIAGRPFVQRFTTGDEGPLTALSIRFAVPPLGLGGTIELRLWGESALAGGSNPGALLVRRSRLEARCLVDREPYDWMFAPVRQRWRSWRLEIEAFADHGHPPGVLLEFREPPPRFLLGLAAERGSAWAPAVEPHLAAPLARAPRGLAFSAVTRCNLNCTHCVSRVTRRRVSRLSEAERARFLPFVRTHGLPEGVVSDYSGDPLFAEVSEGGVLDLLESLGTRIGITTNANVLTPPMARRLMDGPYATIAVSLDAARAQTYARIRRGARPLADVLENVRRLVAARGAARQPQIVLQMVLMQSNLAELKELVDVARATGADAVSGVHLIAMTDDMEQESLWLDPSRYNALRVDALAHAHDCGVKLHLPPPFDDRPPRSGHALCREPWRAVGILGNADVLACCMPESVVGNLREHTLEEIWNGPVMQALRARVNSNDPPALCRHCPVHRLPNNPTSYLYNRVRPNIRLFRDELSAGVPSRVVPKRSGCATCA